MRNSHRGLAIATIILLWLLPAVVLAQNRFVDAFLWTELSNVVQAQTLGRLGDPSTSLSTYTILLFSLSSVGAITPEQLSYLPLGAVLTPVLLFVVARRLLRSDLLAVLLATYAAFDFTLLSSQYNSFTYSWARPLFLTFLFIFVLYVRRKSDSRAFGLNAVLPLLLLVVFVSVYFFHPTYTFWLLMLTAGTAIAVMVSRELKLKRVSLRSAGSMSLSFLVIYLGFNELFYRLLIARAILADPEQISAELIQIASSFLGLGVIPTEPFSVPPTPVTALVGYAALVRTVVILVALMAVMVLWLAKNRHNLRGSVDNDTVLMIAMLGVGAGHAIGYGLYGHVSLRFIILVFPLVVLLTMAKLGLRRTAVAFAGMLVILAAVQATSYAFQAESTSGQLEAMTAPSSWLATNGPLSPSILSDFESSQIIRFRLQEVGQTLDQQFFDSQVYYLLVSATIPLLSVDYIVVNMEEPVTRSPGWLLYEPLSIYATQLETNPFLNKIYSSGSVWVFDA